MLLTEPSLPLLIRIGRQCRQSVRRREDVMVILVTDNMSVTQHDIARRIIGDVRIMGHEDDGSARGVEFLEKDENLERRTCVEVSGCLVSKNHGRIVNQCAGNGHTLHLSAGHLVRLMIESLAEAHSLQRLNGTLLALLGTNRSVIHQRQLHILHTRGLRQKVIVLEDEAYLTVAQYGTLRLRHRSDTDTVKIILAREGWTCPNPTFP